MSKLFTAWLTALVVVAIAVPSAALSPEIDSEPQVRVVEPGFESNLALAECPWITDSVVRLYSAFFGRAPDANGFAYWTGLYESGVGLEDISENFVLSTEFRNTYGTPTNEEFVTLVYRNVLGREPNASGFAYWVGLLNAGQISYGATLLSFSESKEYVLKTGTTRPAAGYLLWFAPGTKFVCGKGTQDVISPLLSGSLGYILLPPASGRAWGHEFDVLYPDGQRYVLDGAFDPSIPNTATVLNANFGEFDSVILRMKVDPEIRWSLNFAPGDQPNNLDTWLGDPTVPKSGS